MKPKQGFKIRLRPREYQVEAFNWAISRRGSVICMPTGTGKTLIAVLWVKRVLEDRLSDKVLVLEPTRILTEQVARYFRDVAGINAVPIYGIYPRSLRNRMLSNATVAVMTPEAALGNADALIREGYNAVVIDECHHTTGKDAYLQLMKLLKGVFKWRLGLSAYIPPHRLTTLKEYIGEVKFWGWADPKVRPYIPKWIGEVYEAELNEYEKRVLKLLEETRNSLRGRGRLIVNLALRWFVRDGALALQESLSKRTALARTLSWLRNELRNPEVRPAHKLNALIRALRDHEGFRKALIFIDRVIIARYVASMLKDYRAELICGRSRLGRMFKDVLRRIKSEDVKAIISTSAGEEGIDLPECDLLIIWSNVASPLRFIQRHGRILRAVKEGGLPTKFVVYLITPDTVDTDSFVDSIEYASKLGIDIPVNREVVEELWRKTSRARILSILSKEPLTLEWLREVTGLPRDVLNNYVLKLLRHGDLIYIFTHVGKVYATSDALNLLRRRYSSYLIPSHDIIAKVKALIHGRDYTLKGAYSRVRDRLRKLLIRRGYIDKVVVSLEVPLPGGAYRLVNLQYTFKIASNEVLDLILSNAYSKEVHKVIH